MRTINEGDGTSSTVAISNFVFWSADVEYYLTLKSFAWGVCLIFGYTFNASVYELQLYPDAMVLRGKKIEGEEGTEITHAVLDTADTDILHQITFSVFTTASSLAGVTAEEIVEVGNGSHNPATNPDNGSGIIINGDVNDSGNVDGNITIGEGSVISGN